MPVFTFSGTNSAGEKVSGERVAENKQVLASNLRRERVTASTIKEKGKEFALPTFGSGKVPTKDLAIFFRQFSVMIDAGLPLVQCLEILAANQENPAFQKCLNGVRGRVESGSTLANAMREYPKVFDDLSTNMIEAGETADAAVELDFLALGRRVGRRRAGRGGAARHRDAPGARHLEDAVRPQHLDPPQCRTFPTPGRYSYETD